MEIEGLRWFEKGRRYSPEGCLRSPPGTGRGYRMGVTDDSRIRVFNLVALQVC
ncbi:MAG: hypothetical protein LBF89_01310 [Bacteroidales bacterium]|jgi:hypothetical protein|nr:hypothetical protein [Bacteroidales bacterium]